MIFTRFFKTVMLSMLVCLFSGKSLAQHRFSVYAGVGPNYYFNNLQLAASGVNQVNYSFVGRFMWEPEHFLSLGFETGYYRLYSLKAEGSDKVSISNSAIPIQIVVGMKFLRLFYFNASLGQSLLLNEVSSSTYGRFDAKTFSLGDFTSTLGYRYRVKGRFSLGAETKFFYSSKANDYSLALVIVGGYRF